MTGTTITRTLRYRAPFDWQATLDWVTPRAIPGVEAVTRDDAGRYWRTVRMDGHTGWFSLRSSPLGDTLQLTISASLQPVLAGLVARVRRQFDLDADPAAIRAHLGRDARLAPLLRTRPGLRVQGAFDGFELAWRAVLGQQVTVRAATTLAGRLVALLAEPLPDAPQAALTHVTITPQRMAAESVDFIKTIGIPRTRAATLVALGRAVAADELPELVTGKSVNEPLEFVRRFMTLPGIGVWTAEYVAMRVLRWSDAFPAGDLGLRSAMGRISARELRAAAAPWSPWRAYAAQHLWASLAGP
jgi:AraC family transcriptional regulator of adaptative response / DNA-3-methyladenine glycosylase II